MNSIPAELTGGARESFFTYELLDSADELIGAMRGVTGGTLDHNAATALRTGGSITVEDIEAIDWLTARVRISRSVGGVAWPRGVYVPAAPVEAWRNGRRSWSIELLGKLCLLDNDLLTGWHSLAADTPIIPAVRTLLSAAGHRHVLSDSDAVLRGAMVWEPGVSLLRVINDLLDAAGFWSLTTDPLGTFTAAPYVRPGDRPVRYRMEDGPQGIYVPDFTIERDIYAVPNRVIVVGQAEAEKPPLVGVAENTNPSSPYSIPRRGRVVSVREDGFEGATQAIVDARAARRLAELTEVTASVPLKIAPIPLEVNDALQWRDSASGADMRATVQAISEPLDPLQLMTITMREVSAV